MPAHLIRFDFNFHQTNFRQKKTGREAGLFR